METLHEAPEKPVSRHHTDKPGATEKSGVRKALDTMQE